MRRCDLHDLPSVLHDLAGRLRTARLLHFGATRSCTFRSVLGSDCGMAHAMLQVISARSWQSGHQSGGPRASPHCRWFVSVILVALRSRISLTEDGSIDCFATREGVDVSPVACDSGISGASARPSHKPGGFGPGRAGSGVRRHRHQPSLYVEGMYARGGGPEGRRRRSVRDPLADVLGADHGRHGQVFDVHHACRPSRRRGNFRPVGDRARAVPDACVPRAARLPAWRSWP